MRGMHHTQFVPWDGEEELDQLFHSYHSDKVIITFRLIGTSPGVYSTPGHLQESVGYVETARLHKVHLQKVFGRAIILRGAITLRC
jgi:hypothetical protein